MKLFRIYLPFTCIIICSLNSFCQIKDSNSFWTLKRNKEIVKVNDLKVPNNIKIKLESFLLNDKILIYIDSLNSLIKINKTLFNRYEDLNPFDKSKNIKLNFDKGDIYIHWFEVVPIQDYRYLLGFMVDSIIKPIAIPIEYGGFKEIMTIDQFLLMNKNHKYDCLELLFSEEYKTFIWRYVKYSRKYFYYLDYDACKKQKIKKWKAKRIYGISF